MIGLSLAFNFRDSAYWLYEFIVNRGPSAPGPGFSPVVIRSVGAVIGVISTWACVQGLGT